MKNKITKNKITKNKIKKPIFKKWWFLLIILVILVKIFTNSSKKNESYNISNDLTKQNIQQTEKNKSKLSVTSVRNDITGNWRIAKIAENIEMQNYALDYYKEYFKSDDEIHAIVNFNYKTTTKISVIGNLLDVTIHEYVPKEEHNAKLLFSGMVLSEYHINKDTGEIEEIDTTQSLDL